MEVFGHTYVFVMKSALFLFVGNIGCRYWEDMVMFERSFCQSLVIKSEMLKLLKFRFLRVDP